MAKSKIVKVVNKTADVATKAYKRIENAVTGTYTKIEDKFVDNFLTKEGETIEDAKKRLKTEEAERSQKRWKKIH